MSVRWRRKRKRWRKIEKKKERKEERRHCEKLKERAEQENESERQENERGVTSVREEKRQWNKLNKYETSCETIARSAAIHQQQECSKQCWEVNIKQTNNFHTWHLKCNDRLASTSLYFSFPHTYSVSLNREGSSQSRALLRAETA